MSAVIHVLLMDSDASDMIMPGSLPLDIPTVKDELVRYLPETWNAIIDSEVDGKKAVPYLLDKNTIRYGQKMAARRVARTIMLGSAPTVRAQNIRGIESSRIRLGVIQPGENIADFNDALNTLRGSLSYLYADPSGNRYWYDTRPTLRKTASDRSSQMDSSDVEYEIEKRLRDLRKEAPFAGLHVCPSASNDVSDEQAVRLVVLKPADTFKQGKGDCPAIRKAEDILNNRGSAPRTYRNMLAFVAPDQALLPSLQKAVRDLLAWESIKTDSERLNLDAAQNAETASSISRCNEAVKSRLNEVYCWLLVPSIDSDADMKTIIWDTDRLVGMEPIVPKAATKMLQNEQIITKWAPSLLKMELDNLLWKNDNHIQVKKLWEYLTTYCYLPRLANYSVLEATIRAGVASDESFAIASSFNGERYSELKYNTTVLDVYPSDFLVKVLIALKQINQDIQTRQPQGSLSNPEVITESNGGNTNREGSGSDTTPNVPAASTSDTRFFMSVKLDNTRVIRDLQKYLDEVITHLSTVDNCEVELSLEVSAHTANGFPQGTIRTVSENCRTLRVSDFGFEK
jgi:predicted AAA+ superfamily ATPase